MQIYFAMITDHFNQPVMQMPFAASAKQAAAIAQAFIRNCPPANKFTIHKTYFKATYIADLINKQAS